nr:3-ketoacyl-ACP reductase [Candidatus Pantoea persica]
MPEWQVYDGLHTLLGAPIDGFAPPAHYTRKRIRSMGRVSLLATRATELALEQAGLRDHPALVGGETGIAFGSLTGSNGPVSEFATMLTEKHTHNITGATYVQMMPHTTAVNAGLFFGLRGRVIPTSSVCTSGSDPSRLPKHHGGGRGGRALSLGSGSVRYPVRYQSTQRRA